LLSAHADELCFMVRAIQKDGFLWVAMNAAPDAPFTAGLNQVGLPARVLLDDGRVLPGLFAAAVGHVVTERQRTTEKRWDEIFVDIGAQSDVEAKAWGVHVGSKITYEAASRQIGHYAVAKALDDRGGLAILTQLLQGLDRDKLAYDLYLAATIQEELGIIGASAICPLVKPDLAIEIDIGLAGDVPTTDFSHLPVRLGGGPVLVYRDSMAIYDQDLTNALRQVGAQESIPTQDSLYYHFGSDGLAFIRAGVRTALLTFPARYTHSPFEMVSLDDLEQTTRLLGAFVTRPVV
jgi:tetrahedral aminopeptidase